MLQPYTTIHVSTLYYLPSILYYVSSYCTILLNSAGWHPLRALPVYWLVSDIRGGTGIVSLTCETERAKRGGLVHLQSGLSQSTG